MGNPISSKAHLQLAEALEELDVLDEPLASARIHATLAACRQLISQSSMPTPSKPWPATTLSDGPKSNDPKSDSVTRKTVPTQGACSAGDADEVPWYAEFDASC